MNPFVFQSPTKVLFGEFSIADCADALIELKASRPLLVADGFLFESGALEPLLEGLRSLGQEPPVFTEVPSDSDLECVVKATELARRHNCDSIVAVGGGSVIDTAKVVDICLSLGGDLLEYQGLNIIQSRLLPLIVVPTTAGTGSEVSFVAMIKDHKEGRKLMFGSPYLAPDVAVLDPSLLLTLPPRLTAATGMDAITHGIEACVASGTFSVVTDALCLESIRLLFDNLPLACSQGDSIDARANTLAASTMAGIAFTNSGVGIVHALAHSVGGMFGTHHGMTNAVFLPVGMEFNLECAADRYARIASYVFSERVLPASVEERAAFLIDEVRGLLQRLSMPSRLSELGVAALNENLLKETVLNELSCMASSDPAIMFNPREASGDDLIELIKRAY